MKMRLSIVVCLVLASVSSYANIYVAPMTYHVWGKAGDIPQVGDYDGDGQIDPSVFRPSTGDWHILISSTRFTTYVTVHWGVTGDIPTAGDYEGAGVTQIAVFRPWTGEWFVYGSICCIHY